MKKTVLGFLLLTSLCIAAVPQIEPSINAQAEINSPLIGDKTVPILWGVAPTADSLHLGNWASLRFMQSFGHPSMAVFNVETAGLDPNGMRETNRIELKVAQANMDRISAQLKALLPTMPIYQIDADMWPRFKQVLLDVRLLKKSDPKMISLADQLYPLLESYDYLFLAQKLSLKKAIFVAGTDQRANLEAIKAIFENRGIAVAILFHPLLLDAAHAKMGKSMTNAIYINDPQAITQYVQDLPEKDLSDVWNALADGTMPKDSTQARQALLDQLLAIAKKVQKL